MAERRELVELYELLVVQDRSGNQKQPNDRLNNMTDLDMLKTIVDSIKKRQLGNKSDGRDSLVFPGQVLKNIEPKMELNLWDQLEKFNNHLHQDYTCRRQMLLRRLDCTVESFKWKGATASKHQTDKQYEPKKGVAKPMNDEIHDIYDKIRVTIKDEPQISIANLLAVREKDCDRLLNSVVSSNNVDCMIAYGKQQNQQKKDGSGNLVNLKQVIIPHVPDRGGRPNEIRPPVRESFGHQRGGFGHNRHNRGRHK